MLKTPQRQVVPKSQITPQHNFIEKKNSRAKYVSVDFLNVLFMQVESSTLISVVYATKEFIEIIELMGTKFV